MLAHFFMIWDEVNSPLLFFCFVLLGIFYFILILGGGGFLFLFVLFVVAVLLTQFVRADFVRARILHTGHTEVEH